MRVQILHKSHADNKLVIEARFLLKSTLNASFSFRLTISTTRSGLLPSEWAVGVSTLNLEV